MQYAALRKKIARFGTLNGILFVALFASAAWQISQLPAVAAFNLSPLIIGIILGMFYGNTLHMHMARTWVPGIIFSSKKLLRVGIVLYGFRLTFQDLFFVGADGLALGSIMLVTTFVGGTIVGIKLLRIPARLAMLTAIGSSVCGAAAVLAAEPVLRARPHESSVAVGTVVIFGTICMFLYPFFFSHGWLGMNQSVYGLYAGATLHEVAHVVAAGQAVSPEAANIAIITKMMRVMLMAPLLIILSVLLAWAARRKSEEGEEDVQDKKGEGFAWKSFPWFALLFIGCIGFNSLQLIPQYIVDYINEFDIFLLTMVMCALGMETSLAKVRKVGPKPFVLAGIMACWLMIGGYFIIHAFL